MILRYSKNVIELFSGLGNLIIMKAKKMLFTLYWIKATESELFLNINENVLSLEFKKTKTQNAKMILKYSKNKIKLFAALGDLFK